VAKVQYMLTSSMQMGFKTGFKEVQTLERLLLQPFYGSLDFVRDYPGEPVLEEISTNPYPF